MTTISGRDNQFVKLAVAARERRAGDLFLVEGFRSIGDLLASNIDIVSVFMTEEFASTERGRSVMDRSRSAMIDTYYVSEKIMSHVADTRSPSGIAAVAREPRYAILDLRKIAEQGDRLPLIALLYEVNDPSNLGSVLRSAEAAGIAACVLSKGSADVFSPKSVRASMGSLFRVPIVCGVDAGAFIDEARSFEFSAVGAALTGATDHFSFDWPAKTLLVIGSEAHGLPASMIDQLDTTVKIDMAGKVESLNLAVSAGLLFFDAKRKLER